MKHNIMKIVIMAAAFALLLAAAAFAYHKLSPRFAPAVETAATDEAAEEHKIAAADFTVENAAGDAVKLSDFLGQPVVINFWASWCPACITEMPGFESVYQEFGDRVAFMMVDSTDGQQETKTSGAQYVADQGYTFPVYFDTTQEAGVTYAVYYLPSTIIVDQEGNIVKGIRGPLSEEQLRAYLTDLLAD